MDIPTAAEALRKSLEHSTLTDSNYFRIHTGMHKAITHKRLQTTVEVHNCNIDALCQELHDKNYSTQVSPSPLRGFVDLWIGWSNG